MTDLIIYGILAVILVFVFFAYLMIRRTVTGFKEGMERGDRR
jgi:preprotein translocase subunit YajC